MTAGNQGQNNKISPCTSGGVHRCTRLGWDTFWDFDVQAITAAVEGNIVHIGRVGASPDCIAQRFAPESGCSIEVIGLTINDKTRESASVYDGGSL